MKRFISIFLALLLSIPFSFIWSPVASASALDLEDGGVLTAFSDNLPEDTTGYVFDPEDGGILTAYTDIPLDDIMAGATIAGAGSSVSLADTESAGSTPGGGGGGGGGGGDGGGGVINPNIDLNTYMNLYAAVQGETNANAHYKAFAAKAQQEGYDAIARLFYATADAEMIHANAEWAMLVSLGATVRPTAQSVDVGTTAENLQAAIDGETYEYTTMYPDFAAAATAEGLSDAAALFTRTGRVEQMHAENYADALDNLDDAAYLSATYADVYLCPVCGAVFNTETLPSSGRCNVCGTSKSLFSTFAVSGQKSDLTYANLYAAVQGETNANAHYKAFAAKAKEEGYEAVARLFYATADAEMIHANAEWAILVSMGATHRPAAQPVDVGTTAENLQAAIAGETYEYTTMYPDFAAAATAEGYSATAALFTRTGNVEQMHAQNYADALANLDNAANLKANYATVYLCPACGAVFNTATLPSSGRCSVCGVSSTLFPAFAANSLNAGLTYANLYAAVQGETNANAHYKAFAAKAQQEGYGAVARLFYATADAEMLHANAEWAILVSMGASVRPVAQSFSVGTTAENLNAAFDGETYEYTTMYPDFSAMADAEGLSDVAELFTRTGRVEQMHAQNYADALAKLNDAAYLNATYATVYLCPVCGAVFNTVTLPSSGRCSVCGTNKSLFSVFGLLTYQNLYAAVQGETNANAHYKAFAAKAQEEGYDAVARLFYATADAEMLHANAEWAMLVSMGATVRPTAQSVEVGTTAENLQAAIDGETYEYTTMYPGFAATATAEGQAGTAALFTRTGSVEEMHANNYADALANLDDAVNLNAAYATVYLCPVCGAVFNTDTLPSSGRCSVCGTSSSLFSSFVANGQKTDLTYANLYAAVQGETNANAHYKAFAAKAIDEGYDAVARLFYATADAEMLHANAEWAMLVSMGATDRPAAQAVEVGTTAENLQAAIEGETYEYTVMYPGFAATATAEGQTAAAALFTRTGNVEQMHAQNYADALANLDETAYLNAAYAAVYLCPVCGAVFNAATLPSSGRCSVCGTNKSLFSVFGLLTYQNLYAAVQGETNANAHYKAFAVKAQQEGYETIARLFYATADAEMIHANAEWAILVGMGATDRPVAQPVDVGTTAENLQAAIDGETYEYTIMYPSFAATATDEGQSGAAALFTRTGNAEQMHAENYADALANLNDAAYLNATYAAVYLCPVCGAVFSTASLPSNGRCSVCGTSNGLFSTFVVGGQKAELTYANLYAAVQGETNANAHYKAFAAKAQEEGYEAVARLFYATADAEMLHANAEWAILVSMGAAYRPVAQPFDIGTTAENLQAAIGGETYEYTVMYPGFAATATTEGYASIAALFTRTGSVEQMHANNYADAFAKLNDTADLNATYAAVYLCPACGAVFNADTLPSSGRCNVCGTGSGLFSAFIVSGQKADLTYANLYAAVQGETNANAHYKAFAAVAQEEGYDAVARLFYATADAEMIHANAEWAILVSMGAADRPVAQPVDVGTTVENLQAAIAGETYEYTIMYPGFAETATAEGQAGAAALFTRTGNVEQMHAQNYADALAHLDDEAYLNANCATVYLCPVCGAVFNTDTLPASGRCSVCGTGNGLFSLFKASLKPTQTYNISVTAGNGGSASILTDTGASVTSGSFAAGTNVKLVAAANSGYVFAGWFENNSIVYTSSQQDITVLGNHTFEARFSVEGGTGNGSGSSGGGGGGPVVPEEKQVITEEETPLGATDEKTARTPSGEAPVPVLDNSGETGYVVGYPDNTFQPDGNITRYEAAVMFYKLISNPDKADYQSEISKFSDVEADEWYSDAVGFLAAAGIILGYEDGTFRGDNTITRAEFATIASKFGGLNLEDSLPFSDVPEDSWAYQYVLSAYNNGWIAGYPDGTFGPDRNITRAEAVVIINRILGWDVESAQGTLEFTDVPEGAWYYENVLMAANGIIK